MKGLESIILIGIVGFFLSEEIKRQEQLANINAKYYQASNEFNTAVLKFLEWKDASSNISVTETNPFLKVMGSYKPPKK